MKPRRYFLTLINSLTAPQYYLEILNLPLGFSLRFFLISFLFLSLLSGALFASIDIPVLRAKMNVAANELAQNYPDSLEIHWNRQQLSTTPTQPLEVSYPSSMPKLGSTKQLAIINTQASDVTSAFTPATSSPLTVVTKEKIYISDLAGGWTEAYLREFPGFEESFSITKQSLPSFINLWQTQISRIFTLSEVLYPFVFFIFSSLTTLLSILINSLLVFYFVRLFHRGFPYRKLVQISLHISVAAELVQILTQHWVRVDELNMYTITYWLFMLIVLFHLRNVQQLHLSVKRPQ